MNTTIRNTLALLAATLLAWCIILVLRGALLPAMYGYTLHGVGGTTLSTFTISLPELMVYAVATGLLLRVLSTFRQLRWVIAFGVVGVVVHVATSRWSFFGDSLADAPIGELLVVLGSQWLPIVLQALAPLVGALVGWWLWRALSRRTAPISA